MKNCPKCETEMKVDPTRVLTSMPPQPCYYCPSCDGDTTSYVDMPVFEFKPAFFDVGDVVITKEGKSYSLMPKEDLTAIELYKIDRFRESCIKNPSFINELIALIFSLGIDRHFDIQVWGDNHE